jgi:hypothetical protein
MGRGSCRIRLRNRNLRDRRLYNGPANISRRPRDATASGRRCRVRPGPWPSVSAGYLPTPTWHMRLPGQPAPASRNEACWRCSHRNCQTIALKFEYNSEASISRVTTARGRAPPGRQVPPRDQGHPRRVPQRDAGQGPSRCSGSTVDAPAPSPTGVRVQRARNSRQTTGSYS